MAYTIQSVVVLLAAGMATAQTATEASPEELMAAGKFEAALGAYRESIGKSPKYVAGYLGAGAASDLLGNYEEPHKYFQGAIRAAAAPADNVLAQRAMAISYAFVSDGKNAEKYSRRAFDYYLSIGDRANAGEAANEIGRICLESGDLNRASDWYERGHNTPIEEEDLKAAKLDLWDFRWAHAKARIAARQGKKDEAQRQVARAKAIIEKRRIPEQESYFPYLAGYVAFYGGDSAGALAQLKQALQNDVMVLSLMAQCFEKLGDEGNATVFYRKAASVTSHTLPAAFAQPFALRKLKTKGEGAAR